MKCAHQQIKSYTEFKHVFTHLMKPHFTLTNARLGVATVS